MIPNTDPSIEGSTLQNMHLVVFDRIVSPDKHRPKLEWWRSRMEDQVKMDPIVILVDPDSPFLHRPNYFYMNRTQIQI
jgi:hypothetical protein